LTARLIISISSPSLKFGKRDSHLQSIGVLHRVSLQIIGKGSHQAMFKKSKGGSSFKTSKVSSGDADKKEILEGLGYAFDSITKKSGWRWSTPDASSDQNQPTESDAIADAWRDAGERTQSAMNIPADTWEKMSVKEQAELVQEALAG
jgi:hypothetical protein